MTADPTTAKPTNATPHGWRWAPAWVLAFVALWPAPGVAEGVMVLGALLAIIRLLLSRFRDGASLLSGPAWALTTVLFAAYWLPQLFSAPDALQPAHALRKSLEGLRYLPFLWLVAMAVADTRGRRITFGGLSIIVAIWTLDALAQAAFGTSPMFWGVDQLKWAISGHGVCPADNLLAADRVNGVFGACNPKLGQIVASLSPFALYAAGRRFGVTGWIVAAAAVGLVVLLSGARAAWITYALVLLLSGWGLLGWKKLLAVFVFGAIALGALTMALPQMRERIERTTMALTADEQGVDAALSGRARIWGA
ncbi:MAG TPA: O-antigen ligase family protein, partial [Pseudoxanthomonas sp.]|nr:O-antigen ligase family protein [Pseudoxanthomonas sp.]